MDKSRLKDIIADVDKDVIKSIATHLIEHELISDGVTLLLLSGVDQSQCSSILQSVLWTLSEITLKLILKRFKSTFVWLYKSICLSRTFTTIEILLVFVTINISLSLVLPELKKNFNFRTS